MTQNTRIVKKKSKKGGIAISKKEREATPYQNYDTGFKSVFGVFMHRTLGFLKIDLPAIQEKAETNLAEIQVRQKYLDLVFRLEDGSLLHLEEEATISLEDMLRFAQTDLMLYNEKKQPIHTVILSIHERETKHRSLSMGCLEYQVLQVGLKGMDGDERMTQMEKDVDEGREINEIELVFIPLMNTKGTRIRLLERVVQLVKKLDKTEEEMAHLIACALVLMGKELKKSDYVRFKKEVTMVNILKYAEELAKEEGMEKGRIEGQAELLWRMISGKFPGAPKSYFEKLKALDPIQMSILGDNLLDIKKMSELDRYLTD